MKLLTVVKSTFLVYLSTDYSNINTTFSEAWSVTLTINAENFTKLARNFS